MNILVLMAGSSDAFRKAGYNFPRSLVEVTGEPMIDRVIGGLAPLAQRGAKFIFAVRHEENLAFHIGQVIRLLIPGAKIIEVRGDTAGAACTALLAIAEIDNDEALIITNGDQLIEADLTAAYDDFHGRALDGGIVVFRGVHPRWSFVRVNDEGLVVEAAEKRPISRLATAGFYYFARGRDFVTSAYAMIRKSATADGAYFVCPTYNELILADGRVGTYEIQPDQYHSLATPALVETYEALQYRRRT